MIGKAILCMSLLGIGIEDFRSRRIHLYWFLLASICILLLRIKTISPSDLLEIALNLANGVCIIGATSLVFWIKGKPEFTRQSLGLGDVWMMALMGMNFYHLAYQILFLSTICLSLLVSSYYLSVYPQIRDEFTVPMAGVWAFSWLLIEAIHPYFPFSSFKIFLWK